MRYEMVELSVHWSCFSLGMKILPFSKRNKCGRGVSIQRWWEWQFLPARRIRKRGIATATWLAGWLGVCPSHAGIVSKKLLHLV